MTSEDVESHVDYLFLTNQDGREDSSVHPTQFNPIWLRTDLVKFHLPSLCKPAHFIWLRRTRQPWKSSRNPTERVEGRLLWGSRAWRNKFNGVLTVIYPALTSIRAMWVLDQLWECVYHYTGGNEIQMLHLYWDDRSCDKRRNLTAQRLEKK